MVSIRKRGLVQSVMGSRCLHRGLHQCWIARQCMHAMICHIVQPESIRTTVKHGRQCQERAVWVSIVHNCMWIACSCCSYRCTSCHAAAAPKDATSAMQLLLKQRQQLPCSCSSNRGNSCHAAAAAAHIGATVAMEPKQACWFHAGRMYLLSGLALHW